MTRIRANSVLPARREDIELHTADGITLVGELALPLDRDPVATLVCLHPLPTHGGFAELPRIWLLGWSFGTDLALRYGNDPSVVGAILLSPPLRAATEPVLDGWAESGKPVVALVPEFDDYLRPEQARQRFAAIPQADVVAVEAARHLWVGDADRVLDEVVKRVAPDSYPLPREWAGPMEFGDASAYADQTLAAFAQRDRKTPD